MTKRADLLVSCLLGNRWIASNSTVGASCAASSPVAGANSRVNLETIWYSIKNWAAGAALQHSVSVQVRGSAGTVLMNVDHVLASSTVANASISEASISGKRGAGLVVAMNTAIGSVAYNVNIAGWIEDTNG